MTIENIGDLYDHLEDATDQLLAEQPWWPCAACPVQHTEDNCCHKALFQVTATEWEVLRRHPYVVDNRQALRKAARYQLHQLRSAGHSTEDWSTTVATFGNQALDFTCPLLGEDGRCRSYDARPLVCRGYGLSRKGGDDGTVYGCPVVVDTVQQHPGLVFFIPLDDVLHELTSIATSPVRPIVAWLADRD